MPNRLVFWISAFLAVACITALVNIIISIAALCQYLG